MLHRWKFQNRIEHFPIVPRTVTVEGRTDQYIPVFPSGSRSDIGPETIPDPDFSDQAPEHP